MLLLIDNHDSFTYNLADAFEQLGAEVKVVTSDAVTVQEIREMRPERIVLSPGPGTPDRAGVSLAAARELSGEIPLLGVCLGHQAIAQALGGRVVRAKRIVHGSAAEVRHDGEGLFRGLPNPFSAGRYHSLAVEREGLPAELQITAWTDDGEIMGIRHRTHPTAGVQFHPESILTPDGLALLRNFLRDEK